MKRCPRCPRLIARSARYCDQCQRDYDTQRGTPEQRGYGTTHRRLRATYQRRMDAGEIIPCARCGQPVDPTDWDLGHTDARTAWTGPEHRSECNRSAAGRKGAAISNRER